ncbi:DUF5801 repeats-in-toxin domain-containing protein, partial [Aestuariicoccus sp. MJ-SS9]|uniref:DUF5801 repeats-in-toxin domain-containing protein n=1 Tax=Aestuariicoccus sp. MJ-SS9 TaxID=3079855 RepID=UPI00290AF77B|nr:hypothetical protein [Aestuariicoccus sp. MJ-SS9]
LGNQEDDDPTVSSVFSGVTGIPVPNDTNLPQYAQSSGAVVETDVDYDVGTDDENADLEYDLELVGTALTVESGSTASTAIATNLETTDGLDVYLVKEGDFVVGRTGTVGTTGIVLGDAVLAVHIDDSGVLSSALWQSLDNKVPGSSYNEPVDLAGYLNVVQTVIDGDLDVDTDTVAIGDKVVFRDDGVSTSVENLVGSGTSDPQFGLWNADFGTDDPYVWDGSPGSTTPVAVSIDSFTIGSTTYDTPTITDMTFDGVGTDGEYYLSGTLLADFDGDGTPGDVDPDDLAEAIDFTMVFNPDGTYILNLSGGFSTTFTQSTDDGTLPNGGPDPVQTLTFDPLGPENDVIFYAVEYDAVVLSELVDSLGYLEEDLNKDGDPTTPGTDVSVNEFLYDWINGDWEQNVGDQGFGVNNNNMNGYNDPALNESFVINPDRDVSSFELEMPSTGGPSYQYTEDELGDPTGDLLEYRLIYTTPDGGGNYFSDWFQITDADLTTKPGTSSEFVTIDSRGTDTRLIDGVQVVMTNGEVKISTISFTVQEGVIAEPVSIDMTATVTDGDRDTASDSFSVSLEADPDPFAPPDERLIGTDLETDTFNIDFATRDETWWIGDDVELAGRFEDGTDQIMLLNPYAPIVIGADGSDATITVGTGASATTVTVYGAAGQLALGDDVLVAYSDQVIDGTLNFASLTTGTVTGTADVHDAFIADGDNAEADLFAGGAGADTFVFFDDVDGNTTISDFDEDDRILISASGFGGNGFEEGPLDPADGYFVTSTGANIDPIADAPGAVDYFIFDTDDGKLYFDANPEDATNVLVLLATILEDGVTPATLDASDILIIA